MTLPAIDNLPPVHPGELLRDELEASGMRARKLADHVHVLPNAVTAILNGSCAIPPRWCYALANPSVLTKATEFTCRACAR